MKFYIKLVVAVFLISSGATSGLVFFDVDGDNLSGIEEFNADTNPLAADTDGDGLQDGTEREFGSDPTRRDTDGDGLSDHREFRGSYGADSVANAHIDVSWSESDPTASDTDGDGLNDSTEYTNGLNPLANDTDGDGLSDHQEFTGKTDPANPDTDGDNLLDSWEVQGVTEKGAPLPGADPLHKDMYVQVTYLRGVEESTEKRVFEMSKQWFAEMPVENPDGETGISVQFYADDQYSGPINRSIDEWMKSNGESTPGVSGFMTMREFYNRNTMGPRVGSYHLVAIPGPDVPVRGNGNAGGAKVAIVRQIGGRQMAHTLTHELLHNIVREVGGRDCSGQMHTCEGFLSYNNDFYLSEDAAAKLNERGFASIVYPDQMNATSCEDTINDPQECGVS